jgi:FixJ family two-component response regulator
MICWNYCEKLLNFIGISRDDYFQAQTTLDEEQADADAELNGTIKLKNSTSLTIKGENLKLKDIARPYIFLTTHFDLLAKLTDKFNNAVK